MTIASTNPATGETLKTFPPDSDAVIEQKLEKAAHAARGGDPRAAQGCSRAPDDAGDGQAAQGSARGDRKMRERLPLLRGERRAPPRSGTRPDRRAPLREALPAARSGAGGDALELPVLAGLPIRRPRADG